MFFLASVRVFILLKQRSRCGECKSRDAARAGTEQDKPTGDGRA